MFQLKIALLIIMLAGAGGGYLYVNKLQKDNAILKTNQIKLETAVEESNQVIEQQTKDLKQIRTTLKTIDEQNAKLKADRDSLNDRLSKHDIGNLAENKPGLVEKIINKAKKHLRWKPKVNLTQGISMLIENIDQLPLDG